MTFPFTLMAFIVPDETAAYKCMQKDVDSYNTADDSKYQKYSGKPHRYETCQFLQAVTLSVTDIESSLIFIINYLAV